MWGKSEVLAQLRAPEHSFSFEFFPPRDEAGEEVLWRSIDELQGLGPAFVSVTYGAGGTTRDRTIEITRRIVAETDLTPVAHLTCVGHTTAELQEILTSLKEAGVRHVLALSGDPPAGPGTEWVPTPGGVDHADELVALVAAFGGFSIGVAAFPEGHRDAASLHEDAMVLRRKMDAGATFAVTEMVLRASDYAGLVERAHAVGVDFPIVPGVMPILNYVSMRRMVEFSGREFPDEVHARIEPLRDDPDALRAEGIAIATELSRDLLALGAPGVHFYTLNRSKATREIHASLTESGQA